MFNKIGLLVVVFFLGCATQSEPFPIPNKSSITDSGYRPGKFWYQQSCYKRSSK